MELVCQRCLDSKHKISISLTQTNWKQRFFTFSLVFLITFRSLNYFINIILQKGLGIGFSMSALFYGVAAIVGVVSYFFFFLRSKICPLLIFAFLAAGTILFCIIHGDNISLIYTSFFDFAYNPVQILFLYCLPALNYLFLVKDYNKLLNSLFVPFFAIIIMSLITFFVFGIGRGGTGGENYMSLSYNSLPFTCLSIFYKTNNKIKFIVAKVITIVSFIVIFIAGSRGATLCSIIFFASLIFYKKLDYRLTLFLSFLFLSFFIFVISGTARNLLELYSAQSNSVSRTITRILDGSFLSTSDRDAIYSTLWNDALSSPLFGRGLWGERVLINGFSHNIFLEILSQFGIVFGSFVLAIFLLLILRLVFKRNAISKPLRILFLSALPYGFVSLLFSGSYLNNEWFFVLLGVILLSIIGVKNESNTNLRLFL